MNGEIISVFSKSRKNKRGAALLFVIVAMTIMAIMALGARAMWETEIQRDNEEELLFRARQYKTAIELYTKKNTNLAPKDFEKDLYEKKFLRQLFEDPMSQSGEWNIVMQGGMGGAAGKKKALLIVPVAALDQYLQKARIIGVASSSPEEGFREYRKKKRYSEWAVYVGENLEKEMPELKFIGEDGKEPSSDSSSGSDSRSDSRSDTKPSGRR